MLQCPSCSHLQVVFPVLASCVTILAPPSACMRHFIMTNYGRIAVIHACRYNVKIDHGNSVIMQWPPVHSIVLEQ